MSVHFRSTEDYELFLYTLIGEYPFIRSSTLRFIRIGATLARVVGEIFFNGEVKLVVRERILYDRLPAAHRD